jgi:hypothetical protein
MLEKTHAFDVPSMIIVGLMLLGGLNHRVFCPLIASVLWGVRLS